MEMAILVLKIDALLTAFFFVVFFFLDFRLDEFKGVDYLGRPNVDYLGEFILDHAIHALLWPITLCLGINKVLILWREKRR